MVQPEPTATVERLGELCVGALDFAEAFGQTHRNAPRLHSQAHDEMHHNGLSGPGGPWRPATLDMAYSLAGAVYITAAGQYLFALSQLFSQDRMALFGFQAVTRALVESAARAWWLLAPDIDARERVARAAIERWYSLEELGKVERASGREPTEHATRRLSFRAQMAQLGLDEKVAINGRLVGYEGKPWPQPTSLVPTFLSSLGIRKGEFWYRYMSGISHSALYSFLQFHDVEMVPGQERAELSPNLPIEAVANAAVLGTASYLGAVERHAFLYGRDAAAVGLERVTTIGAIFKAIGVVGN